MDCTDNYTHVIPGIMYFSRSIPTKEVEELIKPTSVFCNCAPPAVCHENVNCNCTKLSGSNYSFRNISDLDSYTLNFQHPNKPTYECNEYCNCSNQLCGNKLVQCGPRAGLQIKLCKQSEKGYGLFSDKHIKKGQFVCEYAGEIISKQEASARYKTNARLKRMNYIFCIDEHFGDKNLQTFIDPTFYGNIGRYMNHSCKPNCSMVIVRISDTIPVLAFFANKDIFIGEELSYDYGTPENTDDRSSHVERTKCLCGSENCKGFLPYDTKIM